MEEKERMEGQISKHSRICSSDMRLINYPKPQEQKVVIWDKELCNGAEWNDFLKCVEEKSKENDELKKQLAITEKALELAVNYYVSLEDSEFSRNCRQANIDYFKHKAKEMLEND